MDDDEEEGGLDMSGPVSKRGDEIGKEIQQILKDRFDRLPVQEQADRKDQQLESILAKVEKTVGIWRRLSGEPEGFAVLRAGTCRQVFRHHREACPGQVLR